jgi:hypothetical protein
MYLPLTGDYRPTQYAGYAEYRHKGLTLAGEYWPKTAPSCSQLATMALPCNEYQYEGGYASVAYRFTSWLQLGAYNSRYQFNSSDIPAIGLKAQDNHIDDQAFTARFDFKRHWDLKFEQHFMNGVSSSLGLSGFYASDNPQGLKPNTRLFLIRLGFNI